MHVPIDTSGSPGCVSYATEQTIALLIKIDTEGFETGIIASMHNLVRVQENTGHATVRNVVTEISPTRWTGLPDKAPSRAEDAKTRIKCDTLWEAGFHLCRCVHLVESAHLVPHYSH